MLSFVYIKLFIYGSNGKESTCNAGDLGLIPGSGRAPEEGNDNPLHYSCLRNPMDRGAWWATVHGVTKVGHDLSTTPAPPPSLSHSRESSCLEGTGQKLLLKGHSSYDLPSNDAGKQCMHVYMCVRPCIHTCIEKVRVGERQHGSVQTLTIINVSKII